jgi:hypothetical protein
MMPLQYLPAAAALLLLLPPGHGSGGGGNLTVEPWYVGLQHFGPLSGEGWGQRKMTLVDNYTFRIENLTAEAGTEYMFVAPASGPPYPPLGPLNWKQGKIGVGELGNWTAPHHRRGQLSRGQLLAGGGSGRYPNTATYNITVRTAGHPVAPMTHTLEVGSTAPAVQLRTMHSVVTIPRVVVHIEFDQPVTGFKSAAGVSTEGCDSRMLPGSFRDAGVGPDGHHRFEVQVEALSQGEVTVVVAAGAARSRSTGLASSAGRRGFLFTTHVLRGGEWGPLIGLVDRSRSFPDVMGDRRPEGWHVTPIHAVYVPSLRSVLASGWLRRDAMPCLGGARSGGRRRAGLTFLLNMSELAGGLGGRVDVRRVEESAEFAFERSGAQMTARQDGHRIDGDAIYCAGHTHLPDGRIFYTGGARYAYISAPEEREWGLDYARVFHPRHRNFTRVAHRMPLGRSWYPTAGLMPDGRILVTGAFTDYATDACVGVACLNPQLNVFDVKKHDRGDNPWSVLLGPQERVSAAFLLRSTSQAGRAD